MMNIDDCNKWFKNKNINPLTKRKIQTKKATYNKIEKECNKNNNKNKKPKMDDNIAANKIANLFKPLLYKYLGDINYRIKYYNIIHKYIKEYNEASKKNCLKNYKEQFFKIGKRIIVNKILGEGQKGIVFDGYFKPNIKNEQYGKALKIAIKISDYTIRNDREVGVFKKLTSYVLKNRCPHFPISFGVLQCDKKKIMEEMPSSLSSLKVNIAKHKNLEILKENEYLITIVELADGIFRDIMDTTTAKNISNLYNCSIQCLISIMFFNKYMNLCHDDAHYNNFMYFKIKPGGYFHYNVYGVDYYLKNVGYLIMINDFGLVTNLDIYNLIKDVIYFAEKLNNYYIFDIGKTLTNEMKNPTIIKMNLKNKQKYLYSLLFKLLSETPGFNTHLLTLKMPSSQIINKTPYIIR